MCATIVWCVRVCVAFPNSVPPPSPPHTYTALRSRCSQHLRARYLLQIGLNSSAATAPTAPTRLRSSCAPYAPPSRDHSLLACLSLFLCVSSSFSFFATLLLFVLFPFCFVRSPVNVFLHEYAHRNEITPPIASLPCEAVLSLPPSANCNRKAGVKSEGERERENYKKLVTNQSNQTAIGTKTTKRPDSIHLYLYIEKLLEIVEIRSILECI